MSKPRTPRDVCIKDIERQFELASYRLWGTWYPAVVRGSQGYSIRVLIGYTGRPPNEIVKYDYFRMYSDGTIYTAPRGYAKDFKPGRIPVPELEAAVERYAKEGQQ
jgi:hypothetical protein